MNVAEKVIPENVAKDFLDLVMPLKLPAVISVICPESVTDLALNKPPKSREFQLAVWPVIPDSPIVKRRLLLSEKKHPQAKFPYTYGDIIHTECRKIYIFLEKK